eukprot:10623701-Alexandrium_andersonii.AAC.1
MRNGAGRGLGRGWRKGPGGARPRAGAALSRGRSALEQGWRGASRANAGPAYDRASGLTFSQQAQGWPGGALRTKRAPNKSKRLGVRGGALRGQARRRTRLGFCLVGREVALGPSSRLARVPRARRRQPTRDPWGCARGAQGAVEARGRACFA